MAETTDTAQSLAILAAENERLRQEIARQERARDEVARALAVERARLEAVLQQLPVGVMIAEAPSGRVILVNDQANRIMGKPIPLIENRRAYQGHQGFHPDGRPYQPDELPLQRALVSGDVIQGEEVEYLCPDGTRRRLRGGAAPVRDPEGRTIAAVATFADITEERKEQAGSRFLAEAGMLLATSLDYETTIQQVARLAVPTLADWCSVDTLADNPPLFETTTAHMDPAKEELARAMRRRYPPDPEIHKGFAAVLKTGQSLLIPEVTPELLAQISCDAEHLALFAQVGLKSYVLAPLLARGRILGIMLFAIADSDRRYGPADLPRLEEVARRAALAIDNARLYREVQAADRSKDEFLAMLAHELRNPLGAISNAAQLLRLRLVGDQKARRAQEVLDRQVRHMARLLDDLLDLSRITQGKVQLRKAPVDLAVVVVHAVDALKPIVEKRGHTLTVMLPPGPLLLEADATRLEQVVANLLDNAAKYTDPGGSITLTVAGEAGHALLRVRDTGIGIPPDLLPRIFDLFTQADRSPERVRGGLGIGLTLVRRLVEMHGGSVEARSAGPGQGSEFTVRLPLLAGECAGVAAVKAETTVQSPPARRVLLVDDNADAAEMLAAALRLKGYVVHVAHDGPAALAAAGSIRPQAVLLDIGLPGMDGYEVSRQLREQEGTAGAILVALTGYGTEEDRRRSREAGFAYHLTKPVDLAVLERLLGAVPEQV